MTLGCDHNGEEFFTWPIHDGKDISWLKNYDRPTSIFAWECEQDFFGCYDVDLDKGLVQVADHRELKGKKAWTWGQSEDGLVSQEALTDSDGPYIEVQSGPLLTQADYGELAPRDDVHWEEWWYPVYGFDEGFHYATRDVVFEVVRGEEGQAGASLHLLSTKEFPGCRLTYVPAEGDSESHEVDLTPREAKTIALQDHSEPLGKFTLSDGSGKTLAEFEYPLPIAGREIPEVPPKKEESDMSIEELFAEALEKDRETSRNRARELYEEVISRATHHAEAHFRLGVLDLEAGLHRAARAHFDSTLEQNPDHFLANYFTGVIEFRSGEFSKVLRHADKAIRIDPNSSLGYDLKGRAVMRLGRRQQVIPLFQKAAQLDSGDTRSLEHLTMAFFGAGMNTDAFALAKDLQREDPTSLVPRVILACEDPTLPRKMFDETFSFLGDAAFEYVESQLVFEEMGMPRVASLFSTPLMVGRYRTTGAISPIQYFYAAALALIGSSAHPAEALFQILGEWDTHLLFPSRMEAVSVFEIMSAFDRSDGRFSLLRGNALANLGRIGEATLEWGTALEKNPDLAQAHRNLGLYYWKDKEDLVRAEAFYRRAIALEPDDHPLYAELAEILNDKPEEVVSLLTELGPEGFQLNDLSEDLAAAYNDLGEYSKTIDFLGGTRFSNWENRTTSRNLWVRALIERGKKSLEAGETESALADFQLSLTYPKNLGVGRPVEPNEAEGWYWVGKALLQLDRIEEARAAFETGSTGDWGGESEKEFREKSKQELEGL